MAFLAELVGGVYHGKNLRIEEPVEFIELPRFDRAKTRDQLGHITEWETDPNPPHKYVKVERRKETVIYVFQFELEAKEWGS